MCFLDKTGLQRKTFSCFCKRVCFRAASFARLCRFGMHGHLGICALPWSVFRQNILTVHSSSCLSITVFGRPWGFVSFLELWLCNPLNLSVQWGQPAGCSLTRNVKLPSNREGRLLQGLTLGHPLLSQTRDGIPESRGWGTV